MPTRTSGRNFDPALMTLASPDPQAFRLQDEPKNVLQVACPPISRWRASTRTEPDRDVEGARASIEAALFDPGQEALEVPVKLKVHDSALRAAREMADAHDRQLSLHPARRDDPHSAKRCTAISAGPVRSTTGWRVLCARLGAEPGDLVPFEKIREGRRDARQAFLRCARPRRRRAADRARRPPGCARSPASKGSRSSPCARSSHWFDEGLRANRSSPELRFFVPVAVPA